MAKKLDMIKDIDGRRETLKLGVRVLDLWYIHNRESNVHLEMILIDQMVIIMYSFFFLWLCLRMLYLLVVGFAYRLLGGQDTLHS